MNNFFVRAITGIVFVATLVGCITWGPMSFFILFAHLTGLTLWEFSKNVNRYAGASVNSLINTAGGVFLFCAFFYYCSGFGSMYSDSKVFIPFLITLLFLPISELYLKKADPLKNWAYAFASQLYVALPFALLNMLAFNFNAGTSQFDYVWQLPLAIFIFLWSNDTGAYLVGSMLHKRFPAKLFERISPKKSWVGSIGGGIFCLIAATVMHHFFSADVNISLPAWLGFGLVVCFFGTWGDLVESLFKRQLGIKDSGNVLPGHGGMLDRFDSFLLSVPAVVLYFYTLETFA